jgi:uncharacterized RDD family membrane protein YckC
MSDADLPKTEPSNISGFWRRLFALILDGLVLGVVGGAMGFFLYDSLAALGGGGRVIGFVIALFYFGVMNSRVCNGQTLGKMAMRIKVVSRGATPLTLPASFSRAAILCLPYFLNGIPIDPELRHSWVLAAVLTFLIFGVGASIVYLFIFNRRTRQSLHDLAVGSYVVRTQSETAPMTSGLLWRGHLAVVSGIMVLAVAAPLIVNQLAETEPFASLLPVHKAIVSEPGVRYANLRAGSGFYIGLRDGSRTSTYLTAQIVTDSKDIDQERLANRVAQITLDGYAEANRKDVITISITYGYDIGIASASRSRHFTFSPAQWRQRAALQST